MSNLFVYTFGFGDCFGLHHSVLPGVIYCLDIESFIESCELGHACAMSFSLFNEELTTYKLSLIESRLNELISSDSFHFRLFLLNDIFQAF